MLKIEPVAHIEYVELDVVNRHRRRLPLIGKVCCCDGTPVYDVHRVFSDDIKHAALNHHRRILVDPYAKHPRVARYSTEQPSNSAALGEMLIDHHIAEKA